MQELVDDDAVDAAGRAKVESSVAGKVLKSVPLEFFLRFFRVKNAFVAHLEKNPTLAKHPPLPSSLLITATLSVEGEYEFGVKIGSQRTFFNHMSLARCGERETVVSSFILKQCGSPQLSIEKEKGIFARFVF